MRKKKELEILVRKHIAMVNRLDNMLSKVFIPWFKKRSVLFSDVQQEERDLLHFIEKDLISFLKKQKKELDEFSEKMGM